MTMEKMQFLCEKILEQCAGDYWRALEVIQTSADSFFALGDWKNAQKMDKLARFFRLYFNF